MSAYTVSCPQCSAALRSARPVPRGRMLRCPQCGVHFAADEPEELLLPLAAPPSPALKTGLLAFGIAALLLGGGTVVALFGLRETARDTIVAESERKAADERLAAMQRQLDDQRAEVARERDRLVRATAEAEAKAKAEKPPPAAPSAAEPPKPQAQPNPPPAADDAAKKQAEYQARMDAGQAAMVAQRYADALREFLAAQRVLPGDAAALKGQRDAEDRLDAIQDKDKRRAAFVGLMDRAKNALAARRFDEAVDAATAALRLSPTDADAKQLQRDAVQARRTARADFDRLLAAADAARNAGRMEEAARLYGQALQLFPDDAAAQRGARAMESLVANAQALPIAYTRFMDTGALAMRSLQYADAVRAYSEALRLAPNDILAASGLRDAQAALVTVAQATLEFDRQMQIGNDALRAKRFADAIAAFQKAQRLFPASLLPVAPLSQARYGKAMADGQAALSARRYADAVRSFEDALKEVPGDLAATTALRQARMLRR